MKTSRIRSFFSRGFGSAVGPAAAPALARPQAGSGARASPVPRLGPLGLRAPRACASAPGRAPGRPPWPAPAGSTRRRRSRNRPARRRASAVPSGSIRSSPLLSLLEDIEEMRPGGFGAGRRGRAEPSGAVERDHRGFGAVGPVSDSTCACERPRATRESSIAPMRESGLEGTEAIADLTLGSVDVLPAGELERRLARGKPLRVKLGIDPTAPDIHLGHVGRAREAAPVPGRRARRRDDHRRLHGPGRRSQRPLGAAADALRRRRSPPTPGPSRSRPSRSSTPI